MWNERNRQRKRVSLCPRATATKTKLPDLQFKSKITAMKTTYLSENDFLYDFGSASFRCLVFGCCRVKTRFSAGTLRCEFCMWRGIVCLRFIQILTQIQNSKIPKQSLSRYTLGIAGGRRIGKKWYDGRSVGRSMKWARTPLWWVFHHGGWRFWIVEHTRWRRK